MHQARGHALQLPLAPRVVDEHRQASAVIRRIAFIAHPPQKFASQLPPIGGGSAIAVFPALEWFHALILCSGALGYGVDS